ncbi:MAG: cytochrome c peroxidase [Arenicella sp.]|jgi:cytochrome c peroxidase|nr:cytochrome c peroxidase [Arenicella sp.]
MSLTKQAGTRGLMQTGTRNVAKNASLAACLLVLVAMNAFYITSGYAASERFKLADQCPQGFQLTEQNQCLLRSLYQFYESTQNRGVGGTQTGLPPYRDGFSPQQIDLGRHLFFDPIMSGDQTIACASCHQPDKGFSDGRAVSVGVQGRKGTRSAPSLWNSGFLPYFFWDARAKTLELQAMGPLYSPLEMATTPPKLLESLQLNQHYPAMFAQAFPEQPDISLDTIYTSLAAFQTSLVSLNSRYDQYAHGNHSALTDHEIDGLNVFRSFVARCAECHTPPLFTNNQIAVIGTPEPVGKSLDPGAEAVFKSKKLRAGFKVPTLRNITKTAPYMHSGVFTTLTEAAEFYSKGRGHAIPEGEELQIHWHIWEPELKAEEVAMLVAFMATLDDESFKPNVPVENPSGLPPVL